MKTIQLSALLILIFLSANVMAQKTDEINLADSTGLPGDNFSLEGALAMFKDSKSLEEFEKKINSKDESINNLDLNGDGKIDYIKVVTAKKEDAHVVILQAPVSKTETQDVAVIEIEKDGDKSAFLQIIGDEDLYGESKIVEPANESEPGDPGVQRKGPAAYTHGGFFIHVNVWFWPCIQFMYAPVYVVYYSPWYWGYYPGWWSPWSPYPWSYHYMNTWHHHHHYHHVYDHHTNYAHSVYAPRRNTSNIVHNRYEGRLNQYRANNVKNPRTNTNVNTGRPQNTQTRPASKPNNGTVRPSNNTTRPVTKPNNETVSPTTPTQTRPATKPQTRPQTSPSKGQQTKPAPRPSNQQKDPKHSTGKSNTVKPSYQQPSRSPSKSQSRPSNNSMKGNTSKSGGAAKGKR